MRMEKCQPLVLFSCDLLNLEIVSSSKILHKLRDYQRTPFDEYSGRANSLLRRPLSAVMLHSSVRRFTLDWHSGSGRVLGEFSTLQLLKFSIKVSTVTKPARFINVLSPLVKQRKIEKNIISGGNLNLIKHGNSACSTTEVSQTDHLGALPFSNCHLSTLDSGFTAVSRAS